MFPYVFAEKDREKVSMRRSGWRNCAEVENIEAEVVDNDTAEDARIKLRGVSGRGEPSLNHKTGRHGIQVRRQAILVPRSRSKRGKIRKQEKRHIRAKKTREEDKSKEDRRMVPLTGRKETRGLLRRG